MGLHIDTIVYFSSWLIFLSSYFPDDHFALCVVSKHAKLLFSHLFLAHDCVIFTDRVITGGNAIASVRPSL